jgi:hypothetical protein
MTMPNLSICPHCGLEDFPLASRERLEGDSHITIDRHDDGSFTAEWGGDTVIDWDSSTTLFYMPSVRQDLTRRLRRCP